MKDLGTLATLVVLAVIAGIVLVVTKPQAPERPEEAFVSPRSPDERYVEGILGLPLKADPIIQPVSQEVLLAEIETNLDEQFGPGGIPRRARALELLGFEDFAKRSMRDALIALEASGIRGWFNESKGNILVPTDFDPAEVQDRSVLLGLLARVLVSQHTPPTIGTLPDDAWIARRGLHAAIAESVEAGFRADNRAEFNVPTSRQTEREAMIATLPLYLHAIGGLPLEQGEARIFLESRVKTGARSLGSLIQEPAESTLELLGGDPSSVMPPRLPSATASDPNQSLLDESLGALAVQALVEWLDTYEQAQALARLWRGDRYRLFANGAGDHLVWVCRWETPQAATRAAEILAMVNDRYSGSPRAFSVTARDRITVFASCADEKTLKAIEEFKWGASRIEYQFRQILAGDPEILKSNPDGSFTRYRLVANKTTLIRTVMSSRHRPCIHYVYNVDSGGKPLACKIFSANKRHLYSVAYGFDKSSGRLEGARIFDGPNPQSARRVPNHESPIHTVYYQYDDQGNRTVPEDDQLTIGQAGRKGMPSSLTPPWENPFSAPL